MKSRRDNQKADPDDKRERTLTRLARAGDRNAYLDLFVRYLSSLDLFVRHEIHYAEKGGMIERGLLDPCAVIDQVYIAGLDGVKAKPARMAFRVWLRYLALHIIRQQVRVERGEKPAGVTLEQMAPPSGNMDTELWEFYQPDEGFAMEDLLGDPRSNPEQELEQRETVAEIEQEIDTLPVELREMLRLRLMEGMHADEIAALRNESPVAVQAALRQACEVLRARMTKSL
ncbi:MAG: sigma factor-like helix-turn-helix DNA-binding protein [Anaerolineae bacterium]